MRLSLAPCTERGDRGDKDFALYGEKLVPTVVGGFKTTLELEEPSGRRTGRVTEGIGAWLIIGLGFSNMSSWKI